MKFKDDDESKSSAFGQYLVILFIVLFPVGIYLLGHNSIKSNPEPKPAPVEQTK